MLVHVRVPANVKDSQKAIKLLGGEQEIAKVRKHQDRAHKFR